eukprot:727221-Pleurochrysis_carterae.AAC.1
MNRIIHIGEIKPTSDEVEREGNVVHAILLRWPADSDLQLLYPRAPTQAASRLTRRRREHGAARERMLECRAKDSDEGGNACRITRDDWNDKPTQSSRRTI